MLLLLVPSPFKSPYTEQVDRVRGRVLEVDNAGIQQFGIVKAGHQVLLVEVMEGTWRGERVTAGNDLIGKMETDKMFQVGDIAFVVLDIAAGRITSANAYDHYRLDVESVLLALFGVLLVGFAGWTGVRALLSFLFAVLLIWKGLLPAILMGWDPILVALCVAALLTVVTLTLVAGITRTALAAIVGSFLGMLLTCGLASLLLSPFHLHGAILPFSETLLYTGLEHLDLTRVFLAAVFVGASGAVMDVAIDVATAMTEVVHKRPDLSVRALMQSGFAVGRAMTATMVTTLLMAHTAGYMALLMVFMAQGVPPINILNTNYVAAEILKTVVGSFGLVTVAPFTAIIGAFILTQGEHSWLRDTSRQTSSSTRSKPVDAISGSVTR